ncbi:MAG: hypothetical protein H6607_03750 [Flavobacteriales bacterium]|nr:hypothetical protein [Flavobacteriales bacterium]
MKVKIAGLAFVLLSSTKSFGLFHSPDSVWTTKLRPTLSVRGMNYFRADFNNNYPDFETSRYNPFIIGGELNSCFSVNKCLSLSVYAQITKQDYRKNDIHFDLYPNDARWNHLHEFKAIYGGSELGYYFHPFSKRVESSINAGIIIGKGLLHYRLIKVPPYDGSDTETSLPFYGITFSTSFRYSPFPKKFKYVGLEAYGRAMFSKNSTLRQAGLGLFYKIPTHSADSVLAKLRPTLSVRGMNYFRADFKNNYPDFETLEFNPLWVGGEWNSSFLLNKCLSANISFQYTYQWFLDRRYVLFDLFPDDNERYNLLREFNAIYGGSELGYYFHPFSKRVESSINVGIIIGKGFLQYRVIKKRPYEGYEVTDLLPFRGITCSTSIKYMPFPKKFKYIGLEAYGRAMFSKNSTIQQAGLGVFFRVY